MANFFHTPRPKTYNPKPRFYDPEKEERDKLIGRLKAKHGIEDKEGEKKPTMSHGDLRRGMSQGRFSMDAQRRKSNVRLLVLVILLGLVVYYMFIK